MNNPITFPVTPEAFIAYQESGIGRDLKPVERELLTEYVEFINMSFEDGRGGKKQDLIDMGEVKDFFPSRGHANILSLPHIQHFFKSMCYWCDVAFQAGRKEAGMAVSL